YWELRIIWLMLRGECIRVPIYSDQVGTSSTSSPYSSSSSSPGFSAEPDRGRRGGRGRGRFLKQVVFLDPAHVHHVIEDHRLIGWRYSGFGPNAPLESQVFLPEEIWFERLPNPFDPWRGLPPLSVADLPARTDFAAASFMRGTMENNADTGLIVRSDQLL